MDVAGLGASLKAISAGPFYTCALSTGGGIRCWGNNLFGQLGDGTTTNRAAPVDVVGLASGIAAVSAGGTHTCAMTSTGGVKCWGNNMVGQLGDGTGVDRYTPVDVVGLGSGIAALSAGFDHVCALTTMGGVKCWGQNHHGELGDGTAANSYTPVDVLGLGGGVAEISAGASYSCALTVIGGVKCWGDNEFGQLGDGTTTNRAAPVDVVGLANGVAELSAGSGRVAEGLTCPHSLVHS